MENLELICSQWRGDVLWRCDPDVTSFFCLCCPVRGFSLFYEILGVREEPDVTRKFHPIHFVLEKKRGSDAGGTAGSYAW